MYDNLLVPFDGSLPGRAVFAPADALARRCNARLVIITADKASERAARQALTDLAAPRAEEDIELWADHGHSLGEAMVVAAEDRDRPLICVAVRPRGGLIPRRLKLDLVVAQALVHTSVPVLTVGPNVDVRLGLPMRELVVSLDGSVASERSLELAVSWAKELALSVTLIGISRSPVHAAEAEREYLSWHRDRLAAELPDVGYQLFEGADPGTVICQYLSEHAESIMMMSTHGRSGLDDAPLGSVAQSVLVHSVRPVVFQRPTEHPEEQPPRREVWINLPD